MKSLCLSMFLAVALLLSGCGAAEEEESFRAFSRALNEKEELSFVSELICEYEDRRLDFTLAFKGDKSGCRIEVLEPKIISGIKAELRPGDTRLRFEDIVLDTGKLDKYGLSPMSALPELIKLMSRGNVVSYYNEGEHCIYELSSGEELSAAVRFKGDEMLPLSAEIISEGQLKVRCKIGKWQ